MGTSASGIVMRGLDFDIRALGRLCVWAGALGAASGVALAVVPAAVDDERYSYPLSAGGFIAVQCWFVVQHLGLLAGLVALRRAGGAGARRRGASTAIAGMVFLTLTEAVAITAADFDYAGTWTGLLDALYGISTILVGAGLVITGAFALRDRAGTGSWRWVPLATGVYSFVPMLPLIFTGFLGARLAIAGWMLLFALLGWTLTRERSS